MMTDRSILKISADSLFGDIKQIIKEAKSHVIASVNSALVILNWSIGHRINQEILFDQRAVYGEELLKKLSIELTLEFGRSYSKRALHKMVQFAKIFPNKQIVSTLSAQLSWSHFQELLSVEDKTMRDFYSEMCRIEKWSVRSLRTRIGSKLFERTMIAKEPKNIIKDEIAMLRDHDMLSPKMVFRDPYVLDFLELGREYSELDLENSILNEIVKFIKELGSDFCLVDRQKRISSGDEDYYLDLLFFHRRLKRLIAIELKLEKFKPAHKGQMELYLKWLSKYEKCPDEEEPLGIIMCASKKQELIELLEVNKSGIHVAQYVTELMPLRQLEGKLHEVLTIAQEHINNVKSTESKE